MPKLIVLRTHPSHLDKVVEYQKHGLQRRMTRAREGDVLLIAKMRSGGAAIIRYAMWLRNQRRDSANETDKIWGKHWDFIIDGDGCRGLTSPFSPEEERVSAAPPSYGPGGPFVYVTPEDAEAFIGRGLLRPLL